MLFVGDTLLGQHHAFDPRGFPGSPGREPDLYFQDVATRRGKKRAAVAIGHSILVAVRHLLHDPAAVYHDLGPGHIDERHRQAVQRRLVRRLEDLGYTVGLQPPSSAA